MSKQKKIVFLTGTRADFGKIKSLIQIVEDDALFDPYVFVTGMHLLPEYGETVIEVLRCGFSHVHQFNNATSESTMDLTLAKTIEGFSAFVGEIKPDLIVVHGDRVEALAGAITGALNNILVAHIEGGELSGTVDELIRHSVSKLSHIHFVANAEAERRLIQMGELPTSVFTIGSPDIDIMFSSDLPSLDEVKHHYEIVYDDYVVVLFHPVTTEYDNMGDYANNFVEAVLQDDRNYVVIYPNNDLGSKKILKAFKAFEGVSRIRMFPSIRFEYFLVLLKNAQFIIGNSSAGIREAPYYGVPSINIGTRQNNRAKDVQIVHVDYKASSIRNALKNEYTKTTISDDDFGNGTSAIQFLEKLSDENLWRLSHQKQFLDA